MKRIVLTRRASLDLSRLHDFLIEKDPRAASRAVSGIRTALQRIVQFPEAGRPVVNFAQTGHRDWLVPFGSGGYVIRYRIDRDDVFILRIRHMLEAGFDEQP